MNAKEEEMMTVKQLQKYMNYYLAVEALLLNEEKLIEGKSTIHITREGNKIFFNHYSIPLTFSHNTSNNTLERSFSSFNFKDKIEIIIYIDNLIKNYAKLLSKG